MIRIIIADDHWMVRDGIKQLLELDDNMTVVAEASNGESCLSVVSKTNADVLLLDINMPDISGLKLIEEIHKRDIRIKIIILTIHNEAEYMNKAMRLGADGYVLKDSDSSILKQAVIRTLRGDRYIDNTLCSYYFSDNNLIYETMQNDDLTNREIEVLTLITQGLYNKEIGYKLGISEKTVKNHASNIFRKINVSDRTQAAIYAIKNNYVSI